MTAILLWVGAAAILLVTERQPAKPVFALLAFAFLTTCFLLVVGDLERATLLALILALTIVGASAVKHHHSGMKLAVGDLALTFAGTIPFMLRQYRRTAALTIAGAVLLFLAAMATLALVRGVPLALSSRGLAFVLTGVALYALWRANGGTAYRTDVTTQKRFFSFFMTSLVDIASWWPTGGLRMLDVAATSLPLASPIAARTNIRPDIIVIQHESVFDPRLYDLPVDDRIAELLTPKGALAGRLHVDIYGGGSWQTEFSLLTGLSSASFGPDSYFLFKKGVGRFRHSLPSELAALGYRTMLSTSCRREFMNYDAFYAGIGVTERVFSDEFPPPFDLTAFEVSNSDAAFFEATRAALERSLDRDPAPRFLMALTNFNHGPHETRLVPPGLYEEERRFATAALPDGNYGEYYARLAETAESYATFKAMLAARYPDRPMLIVRYGDHQPTMTRAIEEARGIALDDPRQFETFYAIEGINFEPALTSVPERLDIAMLGTIALQASGLPLDATTATRAGLIDECGALYMATSSERKNRFHRTLIEQGMIDLGKAAPQVAVLTEQT
ncbi:sulfatase-like hydrolase/transferase [Kaistia terrae]|uniref:Sulfatase-like hydrolase/transferase n=1 Tax=Kaistia terrae TaxID=537017 RepID=A0ABW0Q258_9HYPH|nr:sulfatase-like hydrolase/transferase [Kaistia terrae]MCX5579037.1 sulfatase-like hydrolase/transferase [Kaistia terrae]